MEANCIYLERLLKFKFSLTDISQFIQLKFQTGPDAEYLVTLRTTFAPAETPLSIKYPKKVGSATRTCLQDPSHYFLK